MAHEDRAFYDVLADRGVTRRDFLKFCGSVAAMLGLVRDDGSDDRSRGRGGRQLETLPGRVGQRRRVHGLHGVDGPGDQPGRRHRSSSTSCR